MTDPVVIIGGGFTGLAAAWELALHGKEVVVLEADSELGGLAGTFSAAGQPLEKFYHHWFTSDEHMFELVRELGAEDHIVRRSTRTGVYFASAMYRLSSPLDVLRFKPLSVRERLRLGAGVMRARRVRDWRALEGVTARSWLVELFGERVFRVVWEPLLQGKFGAMAPDISAVWFWNKLKLRGGSRKHGGAESLAYYRGGFSALIRLLASDITARGGRILTGRRATGLVVEDGRVRGVMTDEGTVPAGAVLATPALPIFAELVRPHCPAAYVAGLERIRYLSNVCLVLELDRSLSSTYWLNVNDPTFPFVAVIEHTNFEPASAYGGSRIVYLSRYLPESDSMYRMTPDQVLAYCLPFLSRMFPAFRRDWIRRHHAWRAQYAQPVVDTHYAARIPAVETPIRGLYLATMAQVYPEDRGTNYAVRDGRRAARIILAASPVEKPVVPDR